MFNLSRGVTFQYSYIVLPMPKVLLEAHIIMKFFIEKLIEVSFKSMCDFGHIFKNRDIFVPVKKEKKVIFPKKEYSNGYSHLITYNFLNVVDDMINNFLSNNI